MAIDTKDMERERTAREYLSNELARRIKVRPGYSLRAFARDLGMSPGELSEILRGKRPVSPKKIARLSDRLGLSTSEARELLGLAQLEASGIEDVSLEEKHLSLDLFHVVSEWYCFAILNLAETRGFRFDPRFIAARLGITPAEAMVALEKLEKIGLLRRVRGQLKVDAEFVFSPSGVPSDAIRKYHRSILQKALAALETHPVSERDITGLGLAVNPKDLPAMRKDIQDFQRKLARKYSRGGKSEVYQLEVAFFRLTRNGEAK